MAKTIKVNYGIGDNVKHFTGVPGKITAIFYRGGKSAYEFSYMQAGGGLTCCTAEECELEADSSGKSLGFGKDKN